MVTLSSSLDPKGFEEELWLWHVGKRSRASNIIVTVPLVTRHFSITN